MGSFSCSLTSRKFLAVGSREGTVPANAAGSNAVSVSLFGALALIAHQSNSAVVALQKEKSAMPPAAQQHIPNQPVNKPVLCSLYDEPIQYWGYNIACGQASRFLGRWPVGRLGEGAADR